MSKPIALTWMAIPVFGDAILGTFLVQAPVDHADSLDTFGASSLISNLRSGHKGGLLAQ